MGGPVELIVLSPAPEDEDDTEVSSQANRSREQELWRRARIVPVATRLLQRRYSQGTECSEGSVCSSIAKRTRPKSNSSGDIETTLIDLRRTRSRQSAASRNLRRSNTTLDFSRHKNFLGTFNTSVESPPSGGNKPRLTLRPLKPPEGDYVDSQQVSKSKRNDAKGLTPPGRCSDFKMSGNLPPPDGTDSSQKRSGTVDEKAKTPDTDKAMEQPVGQDTEDAGKGGKSGGGGGGSDPPAPPPASHSRPKPVVEDRALQALLASRRRSLENSGKPEPRKRPAQGKIEAETETEEEKKTVSEEAKGMVQPLPVPPPWMKFEVGGVAGLGQTKTVQAKKAKEPAKKDAPKSGSDDGSEDNRSKGKMVSKFFATELRQKRKLMGHLGAPGKEEIYCDKDRAAAVALGDQDIKTSLKVKRKKERKSVQPEDTNSSVHMTEALRAISKGNIQTALSCAEKAVEGTQDPAAMVVRGRCHLLLGHLQQALEDARIALNEDPTLVKAVLVQAEALYGMGEFERSLVLFHRGARKRPDLAAFKRGIHKAREAIINAIGGDKFPDVEDPLTGTSITDGSGSRSTQVSVPTITVNETKGSKMASKRLLGGLSSDKEFLASLVNRRSLTRELQTTFSNSPVGKSGVQVAAVAKEALSSLQHLESFMWQRDPGGSMNTGGDKTSLQKSREKKEKARLKASLKKRVAAILIKLQKEEDLSNAVQEGETLVNEVKAAEVGDRVLCRLLVGVGVALPKCGRAEDSIAVLTDAVHIARANEFGEEEHSAVENLGSVLAQQGQHTEAVAVWERRIPAAASNHQRASLFLLIAKSYFAMRKVETGKFYGTKSVREADEDQDNTTAFTALLALIEADVLQENIEGAQKNLEKCLPLFDSVPAHLQEEYESYRVKISQFTEETPS